MYMANWDFTCVYSVRKESDAKRLTAEVDQHDYAAKFVPLIFDVTDQAGISAAAKQVDEDLQGATLHCLVNNAGRLPSEQNFSVLEY